MPALAQESSSAKSPVVERLDPYVNSVEAKTLPFETLAPRMVRGISQGMEEGDSDISAIRVLGFMTQPGETITFKLKSERWKVRLGVYPDPKAASMKAAIRRANLPTDASRSKKLVFTNISKEPYEMLLFVYGMHGYGYELRWERNGK
jgi:hypothetical protein